MLYLLKRTGRIGYDEYVEKLVRAGTEAEARTVANEEPGDEGAIWNNPAQVRCEVVSSEGETGVVIDSFRAG